VNTFFLHLNYKPTDSAHVLLSELERDFLNNKSVFESLILHDLLIEI